ncbi:MAG: hypothetical protein FJX35_20860 [Alphaproteobacteria bacterium]|nr:hypothetical protein [Alphaproteobacteria bacterium]
MRTLKVLVVVMGLLLIAGVAIFITEIVRRLVAMRPPVTATTTAIGPGFDEKTVELPKNGRLTGVHTESGRVILRVLLPGNRETLIVLDLATGERLGTINVNPAP